MGSLIITKTPLRISFNGGGTDIKNYYSQESGLILSSTIDQYIYVTVKKHGELFNENIRLNYSHTEVVTKLDELQNNIARECLRLLNIEKSIYISTISDIPSQTGLGSSSSFAVGLLNALNLFQGKKLSAEELAEQATEIEISKLGYPIGKQDQYAAAFGGLNIFTIKKNGNVEVENLNGNKFIEEIFENSLFFWTGMRRSAVSVLKSQEANSKINRHNLNLIKEYAINATKLIKGKFSLEKFGENIDNSWNLKRKLTDKISNYEFNQMYERAKEKGALGGKILGAGGGGFFLIIAERSKHDDIRKVFGDYKEMNFNYSNKGSEILYSDIL